MVQRRYGLLFADFLCPYKPRLFFGDVLKKSARRFIPRILRHQPPTHCKLKHGLAEWSQISGGSEQLIHPFGNARPGSPDFFRSGGITKHGEGRVSSCGANGLAATPRSLQLVYQTHQFIDLGDDPVLLDKRR